MQGSCREEDAWRLAGCEHKCSGARKHFLPGEPDEVPELCQHSPNTLEDRQLASPLPRDEAENGGCSPRRNDSLRSSRMAA